MANIQERRDKSGKLVSYSIRVHRGRGMDGKQLKPWTATFEVSPTWTEKSARKKAEAFAATFEKQCKEGTATDSRLKLGEYLLYLIDLKERSGAKHTTITYYKALADRIIPALGHLRLVDLRPDILNSFYHVLSQPGQNKRTGGGLSSKSILEHHRLIRLTLEQAVKEGILPYNTADRATPPSSQNNKIHPVYCPPGGHDAAFSPIPGVASQGAVTTGRILSESELCLFSGQWQSATPGFCNSVPDKVQQTSRTSPHPCTQFPPHSSYVAPVQWCRHCHGCQKAGA